MSGPLPEAQMPAEIQEFRRKLQAFNLAVGEWLGLDPAQVFNFDLTEGEEPGFDPAAFHGMKGGTYTRVTWESTEKQAPRVGHVTHGARSDGDGGMFYTAELLIDWLDDRERLNEVGPKPQLFSPEDAARLRRAFG